MAVAVVAMATVAAAVVVTAVAAVAAVIVSRRCGAVNLSLQRLPHHRVLALLRGEGKQHSK